MRQPKDTLREITYAEVRQDPAQVGGEGGLANPALGAGDGEFQGHQAASERLRIELQFSQRLRGRPVV